MNISVGILFGNDTSRYSSIAYIKYFERAINSNGYVYFELSSFIVGANYQTLLITTSETLRLLKIGYLLIV